MITLKSDDLCKQCREACAIGPCGRLVCCASFLSKPIHESLALDETEMQALPKGLCGEPKCCMLWDKLSKVKPEPKKEDLPSIPYRKRVRRIIK